MPTGLTGLAHLTINETCLKQTKANTRSERGGHACWSSRVPAVGATTYRATARSAVRRRIGRADLDRRAGTPAAHPRPVPRRHPRSDDPTRWWAPPGPTGLPALSTRRPGQRDARGEAGGTALPQHLLGDPQRLTPGRPRPIASPARRCGSCRRSTRSRHRAAGRAPAADGRPTRAGSGQADAGLRTAARRCGGRCRPGQRRAQVGDRISSGTAAGQLGQYGDTRDLRPSGPGASALYPAPPPCRGPAGPDPGRNSRALAWRRR